MDHKQRLYSSYDSYNDHLTESTSSISIDFRAIKKVSMTIFISVYMDIKNVFTRKNDIHEAPLENNRKECFINVIV